jgi:hypothetical protein
MNLSEEWAELEGRLPAGRDGRMSRRIDAEASVDLRIVAAREGRRGLELEVAAGALSQIHRPDPTKAVALNLEERGTGRAALTLTLTDPSAADIFATFCDDVAEATLTATTDAEAVATWLGRFARWKWLLQRAADGLSPERQRGLFAELWTIREILDETVGLAEAVAAWKGPEGGPRDFETSGIGIETKSSAANEPQVVPINGERQLDDSGLDGLFLVHLSLEVLRDAGETLPSIVAAVRGLADGGPAAGSLEDRLVESGYSDSHAHLYARNGYELRRISIFRVVEGFPRITETGLPDGIGRVHYRLAIDTCRDHEVDAIALERSLQPDGR